MKKNISLPPRRLSLKSQLSILSSPSYFKNGWIVFGLSFGLMWLVFIYPAFLLVLLIAVPGLCLGLMSIVLTLRDGLKNIHLLKKGETSYGKLIRSGEVDGEGVRKAIKAVAIFNPKMRKLDRKLTEENISSEELERGLSNMHRGSFSKNTPITYYFEFESKMGTAHKLKVLTDSSNSYKLEDEEKELIFYSSKNPDKAVLFDSIENAPNILGDGNFGTPTSANLSGLFVPIFVILLNLAFVYVSFDKAHENISGILSIIGIELPHSPTDYSFQATEYFQKGDTIAALSSLYKAEESARKMPVDELSSLDIDLAISIYDRLNLLEIDPQKRYENSLLNIEYLEKVIRTFPDDSFYKAMVLDAYFSHSETAMYIQAFEEAERYVLKALEADSSKTYFYAHLPAILLYQGRFEEARELYVAWKDQNPSDGVEVSTEFTFKDIFVEDLIDLEEVGITHPDLEKARAILKDD